MKKLDPESLHDNVCIDASFSSNHDLTSQLGYILVLSGKNDKAINFAIQFLQKHKNSE